MKTTKDLHEIADSNNLEIIETISEANGYPSNLQYAIIGFETFKEADEIAEKYGLEIESFEKKDGWQLWYRTGNKMYETFENGSDDYGDNYSEFNGGEMSEEAFLEEEVLPRLSEFETFDDLQEFLNSKKEVYESISEAELDEKVITYMGEYYETIKMRSMYFNHDTRCYAIGLIDRGNYTEE